MLVIRLLRVGKKNQPAFKIVVTDKRKPPRAGRFAEEVGFYNPLTKEKVLKAERIKYWISKGAKPSDTIHNLLVQEKIAEGKKVPSHKKSKAETKPAETQFQPAAAGEQTQPAQPESQSQAPEPPKAAEGPLRPRSEASEPRQGREEKPAESPELPKVETPVQEIPKEEPKKEELKPEEKPAEEQKQA